MEDEKEILEQRARELAVAPLDDGWQKAGVNAVAFVLGGREFAIAVEYLREVRPFRGCTPLPGLPDFVLGITGIRGEIVSVVDMSDLLGVPRDPPTRDSCILVLYHHESDTTFAILADRLLGIVRISPEELLPVSAPQDRGDVRIVAGVTASGMVFLDGKAILDEPALRV